MLAVDTTPSRQIAGTPEVSKSGTDASWRRFRVPAFHVGIAAKITLWAILLCAVSAGASSFFMYRGSERILIERQQQALANSVGLASARVSTRFDTAERDVVFLMKTPAIDSFVRAASGGGVDPRDQTTAPETLDKAATLLSALVEARPNYFKARLLGPTGVEIVRIDRSADGKVTRVPAEELQDKGDRPFFTDPAALPAGAVYVSPVDLNQEHGKIEVPYHPTARVATPLRDPAGTLRGVLVLNIEMKSLFDLVAETIGADAQVFVVNENGDYLANSASSDLAFGFEFRKSYRLQDDFPAFAPLLAGATETFQGTAEREGRTDLAFGQRVAFDPLHPDRFVVVAALAPNNQLLARIHTLRDNTILIVLLTIFVGALLAVFLARLIVHPLKAMTLTATRLAEGRWDIDVGAMAKRSDETGEMARAVAAMVGEIRQREEKLTAQTEELSRSNQELAQFAYVASHDLQEPLRMVGSYLELLSRRYEGKLDDEAQEFIGFAVDGATRMKRLINDLLGYSRAGNSPLKLETVEAERIVTTVLSSLALQVEESGADVQVGKLPSIRVDPVQFGRIFQNLIENALKYRSNAKPVVAIDAERMARGWRFSVADNGIGIDPIFRDKIFEIFKRLHARDRYAGTGIGLAVTKLVVERHGGRIWVEPRPGGGSIFYFTLPDPKVT